MYKAQMIVAMVGAVVLVAVGCTTDQNTVEAQTISAVPADDPLASAAFLAGTWRTAEHNGAWTEEHWTAPAGGCMLGGSRVIGPGADGKPRLKFFEFLRLSASAEGIVYLASPQGRSPATPFMLQPVQGGRLVFENPEHDFPTRVIYWLEPDGRLHARIEGRQNGQERAEDWLYERVSEASFR